jgi:glyoxylase I family protein
MTHCLQEVKMALEIRGICPLLQVFDMPAALAFYRDVLGFEVVEAAPAARQVAGDAFGWVWLRRDGTDLMLNTAYDPDAERPPAPDPARVAAHDDTALFLGCPDVDGAYAHLRAHGIAVEAPAVASYGMKQLYVKDPDGFTLCFQWTADATAGVPAA